MALSNLFNTIGGIAKSFVTPKEGGSPAGNILRDITGTTDPMNTANELGKITGNLLAGNSPTTGPKQTLSPTTGGLPTLEEILGGAARGASGTLLNSPAGQQVQKDAALNYLKSNAYKFIAWGLGGFIVIYAIVSIIRDSTKRKRR